VSRSTRHAGERPAQAGAPYTRPWLPALLVALAGLAFAAAFFALPQVAMLARIAGNVLGTEEVSSVRIFLGTWGRESVLSVIVLAVWQAVLVPLPSEALIRAAADVFGPVVGGLSAWIGLVLGALAAFGISRAIAGIPLTAARARRGALPESRGIARWVLLGLRLVPLVPQDLVSYAFGASRVGWREFTLWTAVGTVPSVVFFTVYASDVPDDALLAYRLVFGVLGVAILAWIIWRERDRIPMGTVSKERKRQLATGAVAVAVAGAAYAFVPGIREWVAGAVDVLASGNILFVRDYLLSFGVWAPVVSSLLMILQSIAAPLPAFVITFANGLLFGWAWGALLSWSSAMAGAAICFWIARSFGRPAVEKLAGGSGALEVSDLFFQRYGDRTVLIARLLPFVSFDLISYGAGLTSISFRRFFIATGIGQLPATLVYSYLGQNLTGSVRILFLIFLFTAVVFVAGATIRPYYLARLKARTEAARVASALDAPADVGSQ